MRPGISSPNESDTNASAQESALIQCCKRRLDISEKFCSFVRLSTELELCSPIPQPSVAGFLSTYAEKADDDFLSSKIIPNDSTEKPCEVTNSIRSAGKSEFRMREEFSQ